ncbi:MAG TPA: oxidoreductase, partial [Dermatophilaceae bacterium]|nr:oxidoreductase [Dermatophilaceae bacterium]
MSTATLHPMTEHPMPGPGARPGPAPRPMPGGRPTPQWWRDAAGAFTWLTMLVVVALWVRNGGIQELATVGGGLMSLGRLLGLGASPLLLVQGVLMAPIPFGERS